VAVYGGAVMDGNLQKGRTRRWLTAQRAERGLAVTTGLTVLCAAPFVTERLGLHFLADDRLFTALGWAPQIVAGALALAVFALLMAMPSRGRLHGVLRWVSPVFYVMIFYVGLTMALPMGWTWAMGHPAAMVVTVAGPARPDTPSCPGAVPLAGMPPLFDRLCGLPTGMAVLLVPGDKVVLVGRRSRLGVFYTDARLLRIGTPV